jgi:antitoxin (DNA-binding transcriptional repressor) of toxin-antitoxin stability system
MEEIAVGEIAVSKFKATCLAVIERVCRTRKPVRLTKFGKPVAELMPPSVPERPKSWLGSMKGTIEIKGNIVAPAVDPEEWGVLR